MGEGGIFKQLTKALVERCLDAELHTQLEEQRQAPDSATTKNRRNGHSKKTLKGDFGQVDIAVPRDRNAEFEPVLIPSGLFPSLRSLPISVKRSTLPMPLNL